VAGLAAGGRAGVLDAFGKITLPGYAETGREMAEKCRKTNVLNAQAKDNWRKGYLLGNQVLSYCFQFQMVSSRSHRPGCQGTRQYSFFLAGEPKSRTLARTLLSILDKRPIPSLKTPPTFDSATCLPSKPSLGVSLTCLLWYTLVPETGRR